MRASLVVVMTLVLVAVPGCGRSDATPSQAAPAASAHSLVTGGASATASPTATAAGSVVPPDVVTQPRVAWSVLHTVNLSGAVVGSVSRPTDGSATAGIGPHHLWVAAHQSLSFFGASGTLLGTSAFSDAEFSSAPVFSANGSQWVWSYSPQQADLQHPGTTTIYMGTRSVPMRSVATHLEAVGTRLSPIAWVGGTMYLTEYAVIGGGRIEFASPSGAWSLDPVSGRLLQLSASCALQDVAPDGSLLCVQGNTVEVIRAGGQNVGLSFAGSWDQTGAGHFSPDGRMVIVSAVAFEGPATVGATFEGPATGGNMAKFGDFAYGAYFLPDGRLLRQASSGWVILGVDGSESPLPLPAGDAIVGVLAAPAD